MFELKGLFYGATIKTLLDFNKVTRHIFYISTQCSLPPTKRMEVETKEEIQIKKIGI